MTNPRSRRFWLAFALAISIVLVTWVTWVQFPRLQQPQLVTDSLHKAEDRHAQLQAKAQDPELNGFLSRTLRPLWDQPDGLEEPTFSAAESIHRWNIYSTQMGRGTVDHSKLSESNERYRTALSEFEALAPDLMEAFRKPVFTTPTTEPTLDSQLMNFQAVRSGVLALITLAEHKAARGQVWEAAQDLAELMRFGRTLQDSSSILSDLEGVAFQSLALDSMFAVLTPGQGLKAQEWSELALSLTESSPAPEQLALILESEMLAARNSIAQKNPEDSRFLHPNWAFSAPGLAQRDLRIYYNIVSEMLQQLKTGNKLMLPLHLNSFSLADYLKGRTGILAFMTLTNLELVQQQLMYNRNRVLGMAVTASASAYLCQHKTLPKSLHSCRGLRSMAV